MARNMKFYYFGYQCPHNTYLVTRIKNTAAQEDVPLTLVDFSDDEEICKELRIFSPMMLLVNDKYRLHGPFTSERVRALIEDEEEAEPELYSVRQSDDVVKGELVPITPKSVVSTCVPCLGVEDEDLCRGKSEWVRAVTRTLGLKHLGYLHMVEGRCVGGAEFLPSERVPYPIPDKREDNAFLTCSYLSDEKKDYRTHPLLGLVEYLRTAGFRTLSVAASRDVVFPNGPMNWFERKGFTDAGVLITEQLHGAEIHYMQLNLR